MIVMAHTTVGPHQRRTARPRCRVPALENRRGDWPCQLFKLRKKASWPHIMYSESWRINLTNSSLQSWANFQKKKNSQSGLFIQSGPPPDDEGRAQVILVAVQLRWVAVIELHLRHGSHRWPPHVPSIKLQFFHFYRSWSSPQIVVYLWSFWFPNEVWMIISLIWTLDYGTGDSVL